MEQNYIPTIGLEIHAELKTKSKLFCSCKNDPFARDPNIYTCPVCLGLPGALPAINKQAVIDTIKIGKALSGTIAPITKWDRKHYFYPDLPKGYQISQFDLPLVTGGQIEISNSKFQITNKSQNQNEENSKQIIRITRIHLEEDTGKLIHDKGGSTLVDLNRAGVPLVELVTEPDIHDGKTAAEFAREYQLILRTLGVADADMEKGMMRVEVNISLSQKSKVKSRNFNSKLIIGEPENQKDTPGVSERVLGTKVEIKNLNSFKSVEKAIEYEINRQTELLEKGEEVVQETRGWDDRRGTTISQRTKETSADYRYFPEPDLPPIDTNLLSIPETTPLPSEIRDQLVSAGINDKEMEILLRNPGLLKRISQINNSELIINNSNNNKKVNYQAEVAKLLIHYPQARDRSTEELIKIAQLSSHQRKLALRGETHDQLLGEDEIRSIIEKVFQNEAKAVADYQAGKVAVYGYLVGQVMRECQGQADPAAVNSVLKSML